MREETFRNLEGALDQARSVPEPLNEQEAEDLRLWAAENLGDNTQDR
ncbi:hypothetical protein [Streptomyces sp. UG1]